MAQTPRGGLYGPPSRGHLGAIYSETTVFQAGIACEILKHRFGPSSTRLLRVPVSRLVHGVPARGPGVRAD